MSEVFAHPELHRLAARVRVAERTELPEIAVGERRGPEPVSLTQQRLWFLTRLEGASAAYHIRGAFLLRGVLDLGALVGALRRIVERHESLRTRFGVARRVQPQLVFEEHPRVVRIVGSRDERAPQGREAGIGVAQPIERGARVAPDLA